MCVSCPTSSVLCAQGVVRKLEYLLEQAIAADEQGQLETAEKKYSFAVETALEDVSKHICLSTF